MDNNSAGTFVSTNHGNSFTFGHVMGHVAPGTFFLVFAVWWTLNITFLLGSGRERRLRVLLENTWFPLSFCPGKFSTFPLEPILKIILPLFGVCMELTSGHWTLQKGDRTFIGDNVANFAHASMFFAFCMAGASDLLVEIKYFRSVMSCLGHVTLALAFTTEAILFYFHLEDSRSVVDVRMHVILYLLVFCCAGATILEAWKRPSIFFALARSFFTTFQGAWLIQIGVSLYGPYSWKVDGATLMATPVIFSWHLLGIFSVYTLLIVIFRIQREFFPVLCWGQQTNIEEFVPLSGETDDLEDA